MSEGINDPKGQQLAKEFAEVSDEYIALLKSFEQDPRAKALRTRRREIVRELVHNDGEVRPRTHRYVGQLLHISGARVGQLVQESDPGDQQQQPEAA